VLLTDTLYLYLLFFVPSQSNPIVESQSKSKFWHCETNHFLRGGDGGAPFRRETYLHTSLTLPDELIGQSDSTHVADFMASEVRALFCVAARESVSCTFKLRVEDVVRPHGGATGTANC